MAFLCSVMFATAATSQLLAGFVLAGQYTLLARAAVMQTTFPLGQFTSEVNVFVKHDPASMRQSLGEALGSVNQFDSRSRLAILHQSLGHFGLWIEICSQVGVCDRRINS